MSKESQIIDTKSLYVNPDRGVATLNYSQNYFTDIPSLINSVSSNILIFVIGKIVLL